MLEQVVVLELNPGNLQPQYRYGVPYGQCDQAADAEEESDHGDLKTVMLIHARYSAPTDRDECFQTLTKQKRPTLNESDGLALDHRQPGNLFPA